jgi:hypothetical protein
MVNYVNGDGFDPSLAVVSNSVEESKGSEMLVFSLLLQLGSYSMRG